MIYILDAYNLIHKIRRFDKALDRNLQTAREALITFCSQWAEKRGDVSEIILVFDGRSEFRDLNHPAAPKVRLVFSETGEDADERIITVLEDLGNKRKCVVSDDNFVRNQARSHQTPSLSAAEFEALVTAAPKLKPQPPIPGKSNLPREIADEITEEYKKKLGLN